MQIKAEDYVVQAVARLFFTSSLYIWVTDFKRISLASSSMFLVMPCFLQRMVQTCAVAVVSSVSSAGFRKNLWSSHP